MLWIKNARIWTNDGGLIEHGFVCMKDGVIEDVGPMARLDKRAIEDGEAFDARGQLLMPGLVNAHTHLYSYLARGMALSGVEPYSFRDILEQIWWRLDKALDAQSVYYSGLVGAAEMLKSGVTTLIDHHASPCAIAGSLEQLQQAVVEELGIRACLCYEITDRNGARGAQAGIRENLAYFDQVMKSRDDRLSAVVGLHASFTVSDKTFQKLFDAIGKRQVGYHIHGAEGPEDPVDATANHKKRTILRLRDLGILGPHTIVAHGIHLSEPEKDLLAEHDCIVAHQPQSNMNNAVGTADVLGLLARNVLVGLGNDGFGSNLLDDLKAAYLLQKHAHGDPKALDMGQAHQVFFDNNYRIAERFFGAKLGKVSPGYQADLILVAYEPPTPLQADNVMGHFLFGLCSRFDVTAAFVKGKLVMQDRQVLGVDLARAYANARQQAKALWKRIV